MYEVILRIYILFSRLYLYLCLSVCLPATLLKKLQFMDFGEICALGKSRNYYLDFGGYPGPGIRFLWQFLDAA